MYIPHRKRRKIGAALLQLDRMQLLLMGLLLLVAILFITAFMQEKMGNFTINLNRLELYRKGISISETGDFKDATARTYRKCGAGCHQYFHRGSSRQSG